MIRYDTIRYDTVRYDTIRYDTMRYDTIRYDAIRYDFVPSEKNVDVKQSQRTLIELLGCFAGIIFLKILFSAEFGGLETIYFIFQ